MWLVIHFIIFMTLVLLLPRIHVKYDDIRVPFLINFLFVINFIVVLTLPIPILILLTRSYDYSVMSDWSLLYTILIIIFYGTVFFVHGSLVERERAYQEKHRR